MRTCTIDGCGAKHKAHGLCAKHCQAAKRREQGKSQWKPKAKCEVPDCQLLQHAAGYCTKHYQNWRRNGDPLPVRRAPNGAGTICKVHGYRYVYVGGKQVREHVVVMEKMLGRRLFRGEVVHHINGVKTDNRPENLMLFDSQANHMKHHRSMK